MKIELKREEILEAIRAYTELKFDNKYEASDLSVYTSSQGKIKMAVVTLEERKN
jgi:hypothetical protein